MGKPAAFLGALHICPAFDGPNRMSPETVNCPVVFEFG